MAIGVIPLHPTLGAEIRGVDLMRPVAPEAFAEIEIAFDHHGILLFREQPVTDEQQLAFSRLFGPLEVNPNYAGAKMRLRADVADISNLDAEGRVLARDDRRNLFNLGIARSSPYTWSRTTRMRFSHPSSVALMRPASDVNRVRRTARWASSLAHTDARGQARGTSSPAVSASIAPPRALESGSWRGRAGRSARWRGPH